jgi:hypothetical protein
LEGIRRQAKSKFKANYIQRNYSLKKIISKKPWSVEENQRLVVLMEGENKVNWAKLEKFFPE